MKALGRVLMVQGTASSAGKSLLVTGLCRLLRQEGLRVAPFKAQNMSNNSYVTLMGEELGRAQVEQAYAAGIEPDVRMNPVLLKPEADHRSQVVVMGRPAFRLEGDRFQSRKADLWPVVTGALDSLRAEYDVVVMEGAGSPAEINLRAGDIVNMAVARYAAAPVLLAGDIDRGGVFAHLYGTLALLEPEERRLVRGLVINKFRGDRALLDPGLAMIKELTGVPVLAVVPWLRDLRIAAEDAAAIEHDSIRGSGSLDVAVVRFPHISNFDDVDPLAAEPDVRVRFVTTAEELGDPHLLILPGTKATVADVLWMRERGLVAAVQHAAAHGTAVLGICGGYQALGHQIRDPEGVESERCEIAGLGLLNVSTTFAAGKETHQVSGQLAGHAGLFAGCEGTAVKGYEIHMGRSVSPTDGALMTITSRSGAACAAADGALSLDGWTAGTYVHGLFHNDGLRRAMLANLAGHNGVAYTPGVSVDRDAEFDRLAAALRAEFELPALFQIIGLASGRTGGGGE